MKKLLMLLAASLAGVLLLAQPAKATDEWNPGNTFPPGAIKVQAQGEVCWGGWYVNADEGALMPDKGAAGLLFDGPSIVHKHTYFSLGNTNPTDLIPGPAPSDGSFVATVTQGVAPLFKLETANPTVPYAAGYSTINKTAAGKYWSSKILPADEGGMDNPVDTLADFIGLPFTKTTDTTDGYTADTLIYSFGVGYANDTGNTALVTSVTWAGIKSNLTCAVTPSPSATSAAPATKRPVPIRTRPAAALTGDELPKTGSGTAALVGVGAAMVVVGGGALALSRRRKQRFES